ncbi:hypothetical protein [Aliterella atlantica]|uniref:Uncharacterized protein n=1 Tax=Aliterella atlantica CENA595 TaxID=1618023 RepID=A0A0D8ZVI4_9CYAN|nr:hypothetical protein [Aliterella atlantica]KJH71231.1 hypothetical protein UH38_13130 [Aliterella atlantica CENA595]
MKYNEFVESTNLRDDDILLIQEASTLGIKKVKLSTLKQYIGVGSEGSTSPNSPAANPPTGHIKWYRADEVTLNGNLVTSVIDKSPSKNNLIPFSGNPTLIANAINGKAAINFNNSALKHNTEAYTAKIIFLIFRKNDNNNFSDYDGYLAYRSGSSDKVPASNETIVATGIRSTNNKLTAGDLTNAYIDNVLQSSGDIQNFNVGVPFDTGVFHILEIANNNSTVGDKNPIVGADAFSSGRYLQNQDIAEILIYPNLLSSQERTNIYSYFKSYYAFSFL